MNCLKMNEIASKDNFYGQFFMQKKEEACVCVNFLRVYLHEKSTSKTNWEPEAGRPVFECFDRFI